MPVAKRFGSVLLVTALLVTACAARADLVEFVNEQILSGPNVRIEEVRANQLVLVIGESNNQMVVEKARVQRFQIEIEPRLAALDGKKAAADAYAKLGSLCVAAGQPPEAVAAFKKALQVEPPLQDDQLLAVAAFLEQQQEWSAAASAYKKYCAQHPDRQDLAARAEQLEKKVQSAPPITTPVAPRAASPSAVQTQPTEKPVAVVRVEGEEAAQWVLEEWGNAGSVDVVTKQSDGDNKILALSFTGTDKDKAVARRTAQFDLSDKAEMTFDVYTDADKPARLAVAFNTLPGWQFFESTQMLLRPDRRWTTLTLDLTAKTFKCEASNWKHTAALDNRNNVRQVLFLVYNIAPGVVYIDNVFFKDAEPAPAAKP